MEVFSYDSVIVSRLFFVVLVELSRFDVRAKIKMANIYTLLVAVAWNIIIFVHKNKNCIVLCGLVCG